MVPTPSQVFSRQVREVRERKRWSQQDLAERLTEMGAAMHQTAIAKIEKGERKVTLDDALRIAAALDVAALSLILPRDDNEPVALASTPSAKHFRSWDVRRWMEGRAPLTALVWTDDNHESQGHRTIDGKRLSVAEARERQRFYEAEVSEEQWRRRQVPGLSTLLGAAELYARERDNPAGRRAALDYLAREVARQLEDLEMEEKVND